MNSWHLNSFYHISCNRIAGLSLWSLTSFILCTHTWGFVCNLLSAEWKARICVDAGWMLNGMTCWLEGQERERVMKSNRWCIKEWESNRSIISRPDSHHMLVFPLLMIDWKYYVRDAQWLRSLVKGLPPFHLQTSAYTECEHTDYKHPRRHACAFSFNCCICTLLYQEE